MGESTLKLTDFAPELLHCVFRFCSQRDLASLSRVNYTFRQAAEYLLHRHVHISFGFPKHRPCLQGARSLFCNLTSNPQKAALLRYVHVKLAFCGNRGVEQSNDRLLKQIVDALRNAHGLEDLRIIVMLSETMSPPSDPCKGMLSELIKGGYFQLHTLYCDSYQDLEGIIVSQKHLRLLGIYTHKYRPGYVNVSKLINNSRIDSNRKFPGIFMLYCSHITSYINHLTLFPEFCLPGHTLTLCRDIATFLSSNYETAPVDDRRLTIHIFDFSYAKTAIICEVVEVMGQYFVNCDNFTMWVQTSVRNETVSKPWRIPGFSTSINQFKKLQYLNFTCPVTLVTIHCARRHLT
ncbi:hypothetical protein JOM56_012349 [Amanita muscaria]